jgi:hypothetical protein
MSQHIEHQHRNGSSSITTLHCCVTCHHPAYFTPVPLHCRRNRPSPPPSPAVCV